MVSTEKEPQLTGTICVDSSERFARNYISSKVPLRTYMDVEKHFSSPSQRIGMIETAKAKHLQELRRKLGATLKSVSSKIV